MTFLSNKHIGFLHDKELLNRMFLRGRTVMFKSRVPPVHLEANVHHHMWYEVATIPKDMQANQEILLAIGKHFISYGMRKMNEDDVRAALFARALNTEQP